MPMKTVPSPPRPVINQKLRNLIFPRAHSCKNYFKGTLRPMSQLVVMDVCQNMSLCDPDTKLHVVDTVTSLELHLLAMDLQ